MARTLKDILTSYFQRYSAPVRSADERLLIFSADRSQIFLHSHAGGLADRLKGAICCFYLAVATGRRFLISWQQPFPLEHNLLPSSYDWRIRKSLDPDLRRTAYWSHMHIDAVDQFARLDCASVEDFENRVLGGAQVAVINANAPYFDPALTMLESHTRGEDLENELFRVAFQTLFKFKLNGDFAQRYRDQQTALGAHSLVGVHLRTGGGNGWTDPVLDDWRNYHTVMERAIAEAEARGLQNPYFQFFSDSLDARRAVSQDHWPHPVQTHVEEVAHVDRSKDMDTYGNDMAFCEFALLTNANLVVGGAGDFAASAAKASGIPFVRYTKT